MVVDVGGAGVEASESPLEPGPLSAGVDLAGGEEAVKLEGGLGKGGRGQREREEDETEGRHGGIVSGCAVLSVVGLRAAAPLGTDKSVCATQKPHLSPRMRGRSRSSLRARQIGSGFVQSSNG